jgi:hypothetical protein
MSEQPSQDAGDQELYHGYSVDDEDQPQDTGDSLTDARDVDPMDEGYSPPEKWSAGQGWGNTPLEEELGETLEQRLAQEEPEPDPYEQAAAEDDIDTGELGEAVPDDLTTEAGDERAGRLVDLDEGVRTDVEPELVGEDVGIDGAAAGAEEAAVHVIEDR